MYAINIIRKGKKGWAVYSEDGSKKLSRWYKSRKEAAKRLQQIEYFKTNKEELPAIVPTRREKDPTLQAGNRRNAKADITRRIKAKRDEVLGIIDEFPVREIVVTEVTTNRITYRYDVMPEVIETLFDRLLGIMYDALELNTRTPWFFNDYLGEAWRQGTSQAFQRLTSIAEGVGVDDAELRSLDSALSSPEYTQRFEIISARAFENMKYFSGQAAGDLGRILGEGVALGKSPREMARDIRKKFKQIEGYRAERIARTEVNNAYNESRYYQNLDARERLGLNVMVMHVSALVENTRPTHAARHGKIYTLEQQRLWWQEGANLILCLCSTVEIVFVDGEPTQKKLIEKQRARGKAYFASHPDKR